MKQKLLILLAIVVVVVILVGLNTASHVQKPETVETEFAPNRSTFNPGITGTQAFYSLLAETGRSVMRWQRPIGELVKEKRNKPSTLVMIGPLRRELTDEESPKLLEWVSQGGRLIVIDREPPRALLITSSGWTLNADQHNSADLRHVSPSDVRQMTADTPAAKPAQPTVLTRSVNAVQLSRFASSIIFQRASNSTDETASSMQGAFFQQPAISDDHPYAADFAGAPVVHVTTNDRNVLVDVPFGDGRIIFLSDPFIVANGGISLADNAHLSINIVTADDGQIAFDEYHQGYGESSNRLFQYFAGTPLIAVLAQFGMLVFLIFLSKSRRFARAVPQPEPDRLSKLEYVGAMAELQRRTKAYDLAIDNIFSDFRRRVTSLLGLDNTADNPKIAAAIAERISRPADEVEELLARCEGAMHGHDAGRRETVRIVIELRGLEEKLGMKRSARTFESRRR